MQPPADAPLRERYVELDEARVRLLEREGDSDRTVLFLHGVTSSAATWAPFLERLPEGIRGVAYDALGCGYTERHGPRRPITRDDLRRQLLSVIPALGAERFRLVAHSLGCGACLGTAWRQPQRIGGMLLVAPAQLGRRKLDATQRLARMPAAAHLLEAAAPLFTPLLVRARLRSLAGGDVDDALRRREGGHALDRPREVVSGFVDTVGHTDLRLPSPEAGEWHRIAAPVWILRGADDRDWMPEVHEARYRELIPTARVIRWEGVGHAPQIAEPRRFGHLLDEFLAATR